VAKCKDIGKRRLDPDEFQLLQREGRYLYSTDSAQGQPILERERIATVPAHDGWTGVIDLDEGDCMVQTSYGPTMLIAGLRCYVASQTGDDVEVPDELS